MQAEADADRQGAGDKRELLEAQPGGGKGAHDGDDDAEIADAGADRVADPCIPVGDGQVAAIDPVLHQVGRADAHQQRDKTGSNGGGRDGGRAKMNGAAELGQMSDQQVAALAERGQGQTEGSDQDQQLQAG